MSQTEPWLRGPLGGIPAHVQPVFFSFAQVREDLNGYVRELSDAQIWREREGVSIGFHLKHMAGSVDRLTTYLMGGQLSPGQMESLRAENSGSEEAAELLQAINSALAASEQRIRTIPAASLTDARLVGRKALPTTVLGLLVHIAEHTQRHLGQVITLAKQARRAV